MTELISSRALRNAAAAGALGEPMIIGINGGYVLEVTFDRIRMQLAARSASGEQYRRIFPSLQSAASFLQTKAGIFSYAVDAREFQAPLPPTRYANAAERMRKAHAAARRTTH